MTRHMCFTRAELVYTHDWLHDLLTTRASWSTWYWICQRSPSTMTVYMISRVTGPVHGLKSFLRMACGSPLHQSVERPCSIRNGHGTCALLHPNRASLHPWLATWPVNHKGELTETHGTGYATAPKHHDCLHDLSSDWASTRGSRFSTIFFPLSDVPCSACDHLHTAHKGRSCTGNC